MKPIHITILVIAAGLLLFAFIYNRKKAKDIATAAKNQLINGVVAISTITTVVDPTTNQEFVISEFGENNLDGGPETRKMKVALATVINDINTRAGVSSGFAGGFIPVVKSLKLKMYDAKMNLVSTTTIANPYGQKLPIATPALAKQTSTGMAYNCVGNAAPSGPGFYNNTGGNLFFGMFCN